MDDSSQRTEDLVLFLRVAGAWKQVAADEVDTIGAWRATVDESPEKAEFRIERAIAQGVEWGTPNGFYSDTIWLRAWILEHHPGTDVAALSGVYAAISAWHEDRNASRVPEQPVLFARLEAAMMAVNTVEIVVQRQMGATEPPKAPADDSNSPPESAPKEPSQDDYRAYWAEQTGLTQEAIAAQFTQAGNVRVQGQISKMLTRVKAWKKAGNAIPEITTLAPMGEKPTAMDPSELEMGERVDHRAEHQREKRTEMHGDD